MVWSFNNVSLSISGEVGQWRNWEDRSLCLDEESKNSAVLVWTTIFWRFLETKFSKNDDPVPELHVFWDNGQPFVLVQFSTYLNSNWNDRNRKYRVCRWLGVSLRELVDFHPIFSVAFTQLYSGRLQSWNKVGFATSVRPYWFSHISKRGWIAISLNLFPQLSIEGFIALFYNLCHPYDRESRLHETVNAVEDNQPAYHRLWSFVSAFNGLHRTLLPPRSHLTTSSPAPSKNTTLPLKKICSWGSGSSA